MPPVPATPGPVVATVPASALAPKSALTKTQVNVLLAGLTLGSLYVLVKMPSVPKVVPYAGLAGAAGLFWLEHMGGATA